MDPNLLKPSPTAYETDDETRLEKIREIFAPVIRNAKLAGIDACISQLRKLALFNGNKLAPAISALLALRVEAEKAPLTKGGF